MWNPMKIWPLRAMLFQTDKQTRINNYVKANNLFSQFDDSFYTEIRWSAKTWRGVQNPISENG